MEKELISCCQGHKVGGEVAFPPGAGRDSLGLWEGLGPVPRNSQLAWIEAQRDNFPGMQHPTPPMWAANTQQHLHKYTQT